MTRYSAVVFDLDGVIADTESFQLLAINTILKPYSVEISEYEWATTYVGVPIEKDVVSIHAKYQLPVPLDQWAAERRETYARLIQGPNGLQPMPGLLSLLDYLQTAGLSTAIASSSPRADVLNVLQLLGIQQYFRVIVTREDVSHPKPAPDIYFRAADALDMPPSACFSVEDSAIGILAAKAAGMKAIGFPSKFTRYQDLQPDIYISDLLEIPSIMAPAVDS